MTYPTNEQYDRWRKEAEEYDMSVSEFTQAMIEAGLKKFDVNVKPDESIAELRKQRNNLKKELDRARERIAGLEEQSYRTDVGAAARYIEENSDAGYSGIIDHVQATAPERVTRFLEEQETASISAKVVIAETVDGTVDETHISMTRQARQSVVARLAEKADNDGSTDGESG